MADPKTLAARYIANSNEIDAAQRMALLNQLWTEAGTYTDPLMHGAGHQQIDALIAAVQQRFPDNRFALTGAADGFGNHVRFSWQLGPAGSDAIIKGTDFAVCEGDRFVSVIGFLDQVPAGE